MEYYEIVKKLIGPIDPIGETNEDNDRYENLKEVTDLVDKLLFDIVQVALQKDRGEYSISRAGKFADEFLKEIEGQIESDQPPSQ